MDDAMENKVLESLVHLDTNLQWIKMQAEQTNLHLAQINGAIAKNCLDIETNRGAAERNRDSINWMQYSLGGAFLILIGLIVSVLIMRV